MSSITLALLIVSCLALPQSTSADRLQDVLFNGNYEFIDLTHNFNNATLSFPSIEKFQFTKKIARHDRPPYRSGNADLIWYAANDFETGEHAGTHIDAPYHFYESGGYVVNIALDKLIVPLIVIDVSTKVNGNRDFVLYKKDLDTALLSEKLGKPSVLLFKFGWSQYFNDSKKYFCVEGDKMGFPGLSIEVAEWITSNKNVVGVGVDGPSVDPDKDVAVHRILSKAGLYNMENVNLYRPINEYECTALVMPMKIEQGTGAPTRLVAICPKAT